MNKDKAIKIALDALHLWHWTGETKNLMKAHDALRDVVSEQAIYDVQKLGQEIEASCKDCETLRSCYAKGQDLDICSQYVSPKTKWVGLNEEDQDAILRSKGNIFDMTEAKLKEKNA